MTEIRTTGSVRGVSDGWFVLIKLKVIQSEANV